MTVNGESRTEDLGTRSSYTYQLEALTRAIREGADTNITDQHEAVQHLEFIDQCYIAAGMTPRERMKI